MVKIAPPISMHIDATIELHKWIDIIDTKDANIEYDGWNVR